MKKLFTLAALAFSAISMNAQESAIYSWQDDFEQANTITFADGATIQITGNTEKNISKANKITVDGAEYVSMKVSNGAQNTFTAPEGKEVSKMTFYSYVNKDEQTTRPAFWKEVAGVEYTVEECGELMSFKDGANPDVRSYTLDTPANTVTFTNSGEQLCYVLVVEYGGGEPPISDTKVEVTLMEGEFIADDWGNQPGILSDGGAELKKVNAVAGDEVRFYLEPLESPWQVQIVDGHWTQGVDRMGWFSDVEGTNEDGSINEEVKVVDLTACPYVKVVLTDEILERAYTSQGWGNVFILNGDNVKCTKVTILTEEDFAPEEPDGEKESIIDKFTYCWNSDETLTHNEDGSITFNAVSWGGMAAWLVVDETVYADWSNYKKIVFEYAEPTTVNTQILLNCKNKDNNSSAWGNPGITSLELPFEGKDVTAIEQVALQCSDPTTLVVKAIYLVKKGGDVVAITSLTTNALNNAKVFNLAGQVVDKNYKGIVICNGKKYIQK
jgi:hypothetical protein